MPFFALDSLFSLIIFIYVSITFLYMFYAFCWREEPRKIIADEEKQVKLPNIHNVRQVWDIPQLFLCQTSLNLYFLQMMPMITETLLQADEDSEEA